MDIATGIMPAEYVSISMDMHYTVRHAASVQKKLSAERCVQNIPLNEMLLIHRFLCSDEILGLVMATSPPRGKDESKYESEIQKDLIYNSKNDKDVFS